MAIWYSCIDFQHCFAGTSMWTYAKFLGCTYKVWACPPDIIDAVWKVGMLPGPGWIWAQLDDDGPYRPMQEV